jgi:hypothetical protein
MEDGEDMKRLLMITTLLVASGCGEADGAGGVGGQGGSAGEGGSAGFAGEGGTGGEMALAELIEVECDIHQEYDLLPAGDRAWDDTFELPVQIGDVLTMAWCGLYTTRDGVRTQYFPGCDIGTVTVTELPRIVQCEQGHIINGVEYRLTQEAILYLVQ